MNPIMRVFPLRSIFFFLFCFKKKMGKRIVGGKNFSNQNIETHNSHAFYLLSKSPLKQNLKILWNLITNFSYSSFPAYSIHYTVLLLWHCLFPFFFISFFPEIWYWGEEGFLKETVLISASFFESNVPRISNIFRFFSLLFKRKKIFYVKKFPFFVIFIFFCSHSFYFDLNSE